jgi:ABC-2 type transport system ATP-binding protein
VTSTTWAVAAERLCKRYGTTTALDGFDLTVREGTVCGLLGPNGAGKTTAVRILTTLLRFDGGRAEVAGLDVASQAAQVRHRIGLLGQHAAVDEVLSGRQNLVMFGRLYHLRVTTARRRADELLERFGLRDAAGRPARAVLRRDAPAARPRRQPAARPAGAVPGRADHRAGPTRPQRGVGGRPWAGGRRHHRAAHHPVPRRGDQLADRISVIDHGRVIAEGSPEQLKSRLGGDRIDVVVHDAGELPAAAAAVARVAVATTEVDRDTRRVSAPVGDRVAALTEVVRALDDAGLAAEDIALRRPTLDEVFLRLTGRPTDEEATAA